MALAWRLHKKTGNDDIFAVFINWWKHFFYLQEYNSRPDRDEAQLQEMLHEISVINKSQREELERVREAELSYVSIDENNHDSNSISSDSICVSGGENENGHLNKLSDSEGNSIACSDDEETLDNQIHDTIPSLPEPMIIEKLKVKAEPVTIEAVIEEEQEPMDWFDLSRENWSEEDKLLQKIERSGSKVLQQDFMSSIGKLKKNNNSLI